MIERVFKKVCGTDVAAIGLLLLIYAVAFFPYVFVSGGFYDIALQLGMSYASGTLLFDGCSVSPVFAGIPVSTAVANLIYPPGIYIFIKAVQILGGQTIRDLNLGLFVVQASVPVLAYYIFRRFTGISAAFVMACFVGLVGTRIYTVPDFMCQVLMLVSVIFFAKFSETGHIRYLAAAGAACGLNIIFKHNIGLAWMMAGLAFIFLKSIGLSGSDDQKEGRFIIVRIICVLFILYGVGLSLFLFKAPDNFIYFTLPFIFFWAYVMHRLWQSGLNSDVRGFLGKTIWFILPCVVLPALLFIRFGSVIGYFRYFDFLFSSPVSNSSVWDKGVFSRGLMYYGSGGKLDLLNPVKLQMFILWFLPVFMNSYVVYRLFLQRNTNQKNIMQKLPYVALAITGIFCFFPLESMFNLTTKLSVVLIGFAAISGISSNIRFYRAAMVVLCLFSAVTCARSGKVYYRLLFGRGAFVNVMPDKLNIWLPEAFAAELQRSTGMIRDAIGNSKYYILGSSSGDMAMFYRLTGYGFKNLYIDLRDGFLPDVAAEHLKKSLKDYDYLILDKQDFDCFAGSQDRAECNRDLYGILEYVRDNYLILRVYEGQVYSEYKSPVDFYIMKRREKSKENPT